MFDALDSMLQKIRLQYNEHQRLRAIARRDAERRRADAKRFADELSDRVALHVPMKSREECPEMSDAAYKEYALGVVRYRSFLMWTALGLIARGADTDGEEGGLDF